MSKEMDVTHTPLRWIRRTAVHGSRLSGAILVSGLVVLTSARLAEASPFVIHVSVSSGGGGGRTGGGMGTPGGGMWGAPVGPQGLSSAAGSPAMSSSKSQV